MKNKNKAMGKPAKNIAFRKHLVVKAPNILYWQNKKM
jgi:hypothetical protein